MQLTALLLAVASATMLAGVSAHPPVAREEVHMELQARAVTSDAGWYSYGCYYDCLNGMNRLLPYQAYNDNDQQDPNTCIAACSAAGYSYAGVEFGKECWCGNDISIATQANPGDCDEKCNTNSNLKKCGGPCRLNIWASTPKPGH